MKRLTSRRWAVVPLTGVVLLLAAGLAPARVLNPSAAGSAVATTTTTPLTSYLPVVGVRSAVAITPTAPLLSYLPVIGRNAHGPFTGTFIPMVDTKTWNSQVNSFVALTGRVDGMYLVSSGFACAWAWSVPSITPFLNHIHELGAMALVTWMPTDCGKGGFGDINQLGLPDILSGHWDSYITQWATKINKLGYQVYVRWGHEMNIPSYSWGAQYAFGANGKTFYADAAKQPCGLQACYGNPGVYDGPERYINAYRRVHDLAAPLAPNIIWVWNPNNRDWPLAQVAPWNQYNNYYPGDAYVDWIALDGYNWGDQSGNGNGYWISFTDLFGAALNDLAQRHPTKPQMITEFASVEDEANPNRKPAWIHDAYQSAKGYPLLKGLVWVQDNAFVDGFHHPPAVVDFRVNSSAASLQAYQQEAAGWVH